jgi:hypothetical protein
MKSNVPIDYYITTPIKNNEDFKITDKIRMSVILSSTKMEGDFDIFVKKKYIPKIPSKNDLIFFEKTFSFFSVLDCQDSADYYLVNVTPYKIYKNER